MQVHTRHQRSPRGLNCRPVELRHLLAVGRLQVVVAQRPPAPPELGMKPGQGWFSGTGAKDRAPRIARIFRIS